MDANRPSYVGLFDILGFRDIVMQQELDVVRYLLTDLSYEAEVDSQKVKRIQFSDTILLYTEGTTSDLLESIANVGARLIAHFAELGIALRGAITKGEFFHEDQVFAGRAMIRAYELEQSQDWFGGILDPALIREVQTDYPDVLNRLLAQGLIMFHEAPIKGGRVGKLACLGWPLHCKDTSYPWDGEDVSWDVLRKRNNAQTFRASHEAQKPLRDRRQGKT